MSSPCNECRHCPKIPSEETRGVWKTTCYKGHPVAAPLVRGHGKSLKIYAIRLDQTFCVDRDTLQDPTRFERILNDTD